MFQYNRNFSLQYYVHRNKKNGFIYYQLFNMNESLLVQCFFLKKDNNFVCLLICKSCKEQMAIKEQVNDNDIQMTTIIF